MRNTAKEVGCLRNPAPVNVLEYKCGRIVLEEVGAVKHR